MIKEIQINGVDYQIEDAARPFVFHASASTPTGVLVKTDISVANNTMFLLSVFGNSYSNTPPFYFMVQGYVNSLGAFINTSGYGSSRSAPAEVTVFSLNGKVCFWFATNFYEEFTILVYETYGANGKTKAINRVTEVSSGAFPTSTAVGSQTILLEKGVTSANFSYSNGELSITI